MSLGLGFGPLRGRGRVLPVQFPLSPNLVSVRDGPTLAAVQLCSLPLLVQIWRPEYTADTRFYWLGFASTIPSVTQLASDLLTSRQLTH